MKFHCHPERSEGSQLSSSRKPGYRRIVAFAAIALMITLQSSITPAFAQQRRTFFQATDPNVLDEAGRAVERCAAGWRQFLSASAGYESITEYFADFVRLPSHYADIQVVENQLNKARYALMAALLKCDLDRTKQMTNQYYKLEAELFFLRNFVNTDGGYLTILTETHDRDDFKRRMRNFFILRKSDSDQADADLFDAYFNEFETKYKERAKSYLGIEGDSIYDQLKKKIDKLIETFKSFDQLGNEFGGLGEDVADAAGDAADAAKSFASSPESALKQTVQGIANRFKGCATLSLESKIETGCTSDLVSSLLEEDAEDPIKEEETSTKPQTFNAFFEKLEAKAGNEFRNRSISEMIGRYELLYGAVNADGIKQVIQRADALAETIGKAASGKRGEKKPVTGTIKVLEQLKVCAANAKEAQCSG